VTDERTAKQNEHAHKVRTMFAGIAGRYDLLNHLLSGNTDKRWRRKVAQALKSALSGNSAVALDVACGTGDLSLVIAQECGSRVIGTDFCRPMLAIAAEKSAATAHRIPFIEADALSLPFHTGYFDAASIAFGLRNLSDVEQGLSELFRILKPGGRVAILEFSRPVVPGFRELFQFYFSQVLPLIGGWISGSRGAYEYLPDSVSRFPDQKRLASMMTGVGFTAVEYTNLTGGIAALHLGSKPKT
jgi:demethylmenaquinone methyltransferase / 2-methoxy-6-polyprenyl-1,4-benzoquinol methylase